MSKDSTLIPKGRWQGLEAPPPSQSDNLYCESNIKWAIGRHDRGHQVQPLTQKMAQERKQGTKGFTSHSNETFHKLGGKKAKRNHQEITIQRFILELLSLQPKTYSKRYEPYLLTMSSCHKVLVSMKNQYNTNKTLYNIIKSPISKILSSKGFETTSHLTK